MREMMFDTGDDILIPNSSTIGRLLFGINKDTKLVIGVGSGVINDSIKYATSRCHIPYIIVAPAAPCSDSDRYSDSGSDCYLPFFCP